MNTRPLFSGQWLPQRNHPIPSRDAQCAEHFLVVARHPRGLVSISDSEMIRILSPVDTLRLIKQLAEAVGTVPAGPLSGSF